VGNYAPFKKQAQAHKAFLVDGYKRGVLYWGRRTGKSAWSMQQLTYSCLLHQGPHHIVFKEYQQAETVAWNQYVPLIPQGFIKELNKSTLTITFHYFTGDIEISPGNFVHVEADQSKPPASIRLFGSDRADSHRGLESYGMIFDEYQDQDTYGWDFVYRQFLYTTNGWACFMGTAKSKDNWIEMQEDAEASYQESEERGYRLAGDWFFSKATWKDNPLIQSDVIEADRLDAERKGKMGAFLQETELIPFSQQGAVYPMFSKKIHGVSADKIPDKGTDYIALDYGFAEGHPMAALFIRITRDDIWYQWDEIHGTGIQIDDLIAEIRIKMGDRKLTAIIADSARPDLIDYMASKGLPMIPAPKHQNSIASGIQLLSRRLKPKIQIIGEPKPNFYIDTKACPATVYDFTHYRYKEVKENRHPMENPEKRYDDTMDAMRYLELHFKYGQTKSDKLPESSMLKEMGNYGVNF
jgi:hypothetical protein